MRICAHCGQEVAAADLCPNCGQEMPAVWPPPPGGPAALPGASPPPPPGAQVALGLVLGIVFFPVFVPLIAWMLGGVPSLRNSFASGYIETLAVVALALGLYFGTRRRFRTFARFFGWTVLGTVAAALGALALCYALIR